MNFTYYPIVCFCGGMLCKFAFEFYELLLSFIICCFGVFYCCFVLSIDDVNFIFTFILLTFTTCFNPIIRLLEGWGVHWSCKGWDVNF